MTAVGLGQHGSPAECQGPSLCRAKYFYDFTGICQKFHSNGSNGTVGRTTGFWDGRSGFESLSHQIFSWFHWHLSEIPMVPMAQWVGQQGFEAVDTGSNPSLHLHLWQLLRRKIVILPLSSPPLIFKLFRSWKSSETQHTRVPLRFFSVLRDKKFSIENRYFTLLGIKFFDTRNFLKGSSTKCFDTLRQNKFGGKSWYPPPLIPNIFRYQNFLKHRRVPLRNVLILWDKTFLTENRDTRRLSYPQHFSISEIFWNTEGFLFEVFRHYETKIFQRKIVIPFSRNYRN